MNTLRLLNVGAALGALAIGATVALSVGSFERRTPVPSGATPAAETRVLRDATGARVPVRPYQRIVSGSTVADSLLLALAEPTRVVGYTHYGATASPYGYLHAGRVAPDGLEGILSLRPDLVLLHGHGRPDLTARLREAGVAVFDLGEMRGLSTLLSDALTVATLLGHPERGALLARRFERRMRALARHVAADDRPTALYLSVQPGALFGGGAGSSYHDVLEAAGLRDVAAERYVGWPKYSSEQVLELDPEIIVTHDGMRAPLCRHPGLANLRACGPSGRIVEVDGFLIGDPSLRMLEAAENVFEAVHATSERSRGAETPHRSD